MTAFSDWILWEPVWGQFFEMSSKRLKHKSQKWRHLKIGLYFWKHSSTHPKSYESYVSDPETVLTKHLLTNTVGFYGCSLNINQNFKKPKNNNHPTGELEGNWTVCYLMNFTVSVTSLSCSILSAAHFCPACIDIFCRLLAMLLSQATPEDDPLAY